MKLNLNKLKNTAAVIMMSYKRFPVTVISSTILAALIIWLGEISPGLTFEETQFFLRINMSIGIFVILSLNIALFHEAYIKKSKIIQLASFLVAAFLTVGYFYFFLTEIRPVSMMRFFAVILTLIIIVFFIQRIKTQSFYEAYVIKIFNGIFTTGIYAGVLYAGISIIMFTISTLFSVDIAGKFYLYSFTLVIFVFAVATFLSKLPDHGTDHISFVYPESLKVLLIYIVIPLISIYTIILYAYSARILISGVWPQGLVSHLVLWYSTVSVGVIFMLTPVYTQNRISSLFRRWFPILILPVLGIMFTSIGLRIGQYGITENRYLVVILGLWVTFIMVYFSVKKSQRNIVIPISLALVVLISMFGPLSSFSVSIRSQNNRLINILNENNMIQDGIVSPNPSIPTNAKNEISRVLDYFNNVHTLEKAYALPEGFELRDMAAVFGFEYQPEYGIPSTDYFYYHTDLTKYPLLISEYDYYFSLNPWSQNREPIDGITINFSLEQLKIIIVKESTELIEIELDPFVKEIYLNQNILDEKDMEIPKSKMTFTGENSNVKYSITFVNLGGYGDAAGDPIIESIDFVLLLGIK